MMKANWEIVDTKLHTILAKIGHSIGLVIVLEIPVDMSWLVKDVHEEDLSAEEYRMDIWVALDLNYRLV
jgi:hypothetical protein